MPSTVIVSGKANIYGAGVAAPPSPGGGGGGVLPVAVSLSSLGTPAKLDFPVVTGTVSGWAAAGHYNGPDGGPFWGGKTNVPAWKGISGIKDTHATMFLVGVFLGPNGQTSQAPPTLDVTNANNYISSSPLLGQQFFIGNGRAGSGALQTVTVPTGASTLFLGFAENFQFGNPHRLPGFYSDNGGSLQVEVAKLPDIVMNSVVATSKKALTFNYSIENGDVGQPFTVAIYRATKPLYDPNDPQTAADYQEIAVTTIPTAQATEGLNRQVEVQIPGGFLPQPSRPFVLAVANPDLAIQETNTDNDCKRPLNYIFHRRLLWGFSFSEETSRCPRATLVARSWSAAGAT